MRKISLGNSQSVMNVQSFFPNNAQSKPSGDSSRTVKEKVFPGFLNEILTKDTTVTFF
jgi:hypothetical protein